MSLQVDIEKKLGKFTLKVQFDMEREIVAILGESGCGKSMTLKCIAGIETPDRGRIVLNGKILYDFEKRINLPPQKRKIGYMFQDYALFPNMTVRKNIMAGMGRDGNQVEEYIKRFHLEGLEEHYPHQLSGGQKQRTAMARMLAANPEMILLDEPFSALDTHLKRELEQEMKETLYASRKPVLFVSHDQGEVFRLCDRVSCMERGHLDQPEELKAFFQTPKTIRAAKISGCENIAYIKWEDSERICVEDWGIRWEISSDYLKKEEKKAAAIHAEQFGVEKGEDMLCFPVKNAHVTEELYGWSVRFQTDDQGAWIVWKVFRNHTKDASFTIPEKLYVRKSDILLLAE